MHVFHDLQPYICCAPAGECRDSLVTFPSRRLWADHEFSHHHAFDVWDCKDCLKEFGSEQSYIKQVELDHYISSDGQPMQILLNSAKRSVSKQVEDQECPLCLQTCFNSRRLLTKHLGGHMEEIALSSLPREVESDIDEEEYWDFGQLKRVSCTGRDEDAAHGDETLQETSELARKTFALLKPADARDEPDPADAAQETSCWWKGCEGLDLGTIDDLTEHVKDERLWEVESYNREPKTALCNFCTDHPLGFYSDGELQRHVERAHASVRRVWICKDPNPNDDFLINCKACRNRKTYGSNNNAAAHLRRTHFNPCPNERGGKISENRGGKGGGDKPAMEFLKDWMYDMWEFDIYGAKVLQPMMDDGVVPGLPLDWKSKLNVRKET